MSSPESPPSTGETARAVKRWVEGDNRALDSILRRLLPRLRLRARRRLGKTLRRRCDSRDAVQDTLQQFLAASERFEIRSARELEGLLMKMCENLIRQDRKAQQRLCRNVAREERLATDAPAISQQTSPSGAAVKREQYAWIDGALEAMDPVDRKIVELRIRGSQTFEAIAQVTGLTAEAARKRGKRAMDRLRERRPS